MAARSETGAGVRAAPPAGGVHTALSPGERADAPVGYGLSAALHAILLAGVLLGGELFVARDTRSVEVIELNLLSVSEFDALSQRETAAPAPAPQAPPVPVPEEPAPAVELPEPDPAEPPPESSTVLSAPPSPEEEVVEVEVEPSAPPEPPAPPVEAVEAVEARVPDPAVPPDPPALPAEEVEVPEPPAPPDPPEEEVAAEVPDLPDSPPARRPEYVPAPDVAEELAAILGDPEDTAAPRTAAFFSTDLSVSERAYLRRRVSNCWNASAIVGARDAHTLRVTVGVDFTADGQLRQPPVLVRPRPLPSVAHRTALDAARAALIRCAPYDRLPRHEYERWQRLEFTFDPTGMVAR